MVFIKSFKTYTVSIKIVHVMLIVNNSLFSQIPLNSKLKDKNQSEKQKKQKKTHIRPYLVQLLILNLFTVIEKCLACKIDNS